MVGKTPLTVQEQEGLHLFRSESLSPLSLSLSVDTHTHAHTHTHTHIAHTCALTSMCVCVGGWLGRMFRDIHELPRDDNEEEEEEEEEEGHDGGGGEGGATREAMDDDAQAQILKDIFKS